MYPPKWSDVLALALRATMTTTCEGDLLEAPSRIVSDRKQNFQELIAIIRTCMSGVGHFEVSDHARPGVLKFLAYLSRLDRSALSWNLNSPFPFSSLALAGSPMRR